MEYMNQKYKTLEDHENQIDKNLIAAKFHKNVAYQLATLSLA